MKALFDKMTFITTSEGKDEIRGARFKNDRTTQKTVRLMIKQDNNFYSDLFIFSTTVIRGKHAGTSLKKLMDFGTSISENDVDKIAEFLREDPTFNSLANLTEYDEKDTFSTVCSRLLDKGDKIDDHVLLSNEAFNTIAKNCGYKVPLRLKKIFLESDILAPSSSRRYDYKATEDGPWMVRLRLQMLVNEVHEHAN